MSLRPIIGMPLWKQIVMADTRFGRAVTCGAAMGGSGHHKQPTAPFLFGAAGSSTPVNRQAGVPSAPNPPRLTGGRRAGYFLGRFLPEPVPYGPAN